MARKLGTSIVTTATGQETLIHRIDYREGNGTASFEVEIEGLDYRVKSSSLKEAVEKATKHAIMVSGAVCASFVRYAQDQYGGMDIIEVVVYDNRWGSGCLMRSKDGHLVTMMRGKDYPLVPATPEAVKVFGAIRDRIEELGALVERANDELVDFKEAVKAQLQEGPPSLEGLIE